MLFIQTCIFCDSPKHPTVFFLLSGAHFGSSPGHSGVWMYCLCGGQQGEAPKHPDLAGKMLWFTNWWFLSVTWRKTKDVEKMEKLQN